MKISELKTVKNFALEKGVTTQAIYKWIAAGKLEAIKIDGIKFIHSPKN